MKTIPEKYSHRFKPLVYLSALSALVVNSKSQFFISLAIFSSLISVTSHAQDKNEIPVKDPVKLIEQVNLFSQKTTSITAYFFQVKEMSFMEETVTTTGRFYFQKEDRVRWEYTDPFHYAIIVNGERIRIIDEGKQKDIDAGSSRMFREISQVITGMVNGTLLTDGRFAASWLEAADYYKAELIPADDVMKDYLSKIELKLNKTDYSVDELKMVEKSGDYTIIAFRNKKLNEKIPADIFRLD